MASTVQLLCDVLCWFFFNKTRILLCVTKRAERDDPLFKYWYYKYNGAEPGGVPEASLARLTVAQSEGV